MAPRFHRFLVRILLPLALVLLAGCSRRAPPVAVDGFLDLSGWNFETGGVVKLDGAWEFYWQQFLTPADITGGAAPDIRPTGFLPVPGPWSGFRAGGTALPRDGYATYRLRVRLPEAGGVKAIAIPYVCMAYRLWVDDELLAANGIAGTDRASTVPQTVPLIAFFRPRADTIQIVVQAANFHHRCNGLWESLRLGPAAQVARQEEIRSAVALMHFAAFLIMAAYHLALHALRGRERSLLHFALFSLAIAIRTLVTDQMFIVRLFPDFPWETQLRIEYFADYAALPAVYAFLRSLFPREMPVWAVRSALAAALGGTLTLAFPGRVSSLFIPPYEVALVGYIAYALVVLGRALTRRREGAALYVAGLVVFFAALVHDLLVLNLILHRGQLLPFGLLVLTLAQSVVLAQRFAAAHGELQRSRRMITEREEQVRKQIAEMLHGQVQGRLLMVGYRLHEAERLWDRDPAEARAMVAGAREEIREVCEADVRRASHLLHPAVIDVGLVPALRSLAMRYRTRFQVDLEVGPAVSPIDAVTGPGIPEAVRLAAYRVVEEALGNVQAHAGARRVVVTLQVTPERELHLCVRDDGRGVDPARLERGLGLRTVAARVSEMGGRWEIEGAPGRGTALLAWLPLDLADKG